MLVAHRFEQSMSWVDCVESAMPFHFGGVTQCGRLNSHNNNQDAMALWSRTDCIVGVVCDGCSTSSTGFSNNEVGSRILSMLSAQLIGEACLTKGVAQLPATLIDLERGICERLLQVISVLAPDEQRNTLLNSFFMSTVLAFVVDQQHFAVLGCGDGFYAINEEIVSLDDSSGRYLAGRLRSDKDWRALLTAGEGALQLHRIGETPNLRSLLVGSDGFEELTERFRDPFKEFLIGPDFGVSGNGFWPAMAADYRSRFWQLPQVQDWAATQDAHDDRTFLLLRRLNTTGKENSVACCKSQEMTSPNLEVSSPL